MICLLFLDDFEAGFANFDQMNSSSSWPDSFPPANTSTEIAESAVKGEIVESSLKEQPETVISQWSPDFSNDPFGSGSENASDAVAAPTTEGCVDTSSPKTSLPEKEDEVMEQ